MKTGVVVGNPKPKSRTFAAANLVAEKLIGTAPDYVLDIADLGAGLLEWGDTDVATAVETVQGLEMVVFASPTYKATYTGLMKLFLDQIPQDGLAGVTALPVMLGASPSHLLAPDLLFKPVLVELGATCPTVGLYLIDTSFAEDPRLDAWVARTRVALPGGLA